MADFPKKLKIKTGIVKRLHKDLAYYNKEEAEQKKKIENLRAAGADTHDVDKQEEVLAETLSMIPDTKGRLENALVDLQAMMDTFDGDDSVKQSAEWQDAETTRQAVEPLFEA